MNPPSMEAHTMKHYAILYFSTLIVMTVLDLVWIGGIARGFYKERMGGLMELHMLPGIAFYLLYIVGILVFVHGGNHTQWQPVMLYGALFGLVAYGTYDLTNLATLRGWSATLAVVDMLWGACATGVAATCGYLITRFFEQA